MPPTRILSTQSKPSGTAVPMRKGMATRNSTTSNQLTKQSVVIRETRLKRKADASPPKDKTVKRSALGNITNVTKAIGKTFTQVNDPKKLVKKTIVTQSKAAVTSKVQISSQTIGLRSLDKILVKNDNKLLAKTKLPARSTKFVKKDEEKLEIPEVAALRRSVDLEKSEDNSLYVSALEEVAEENLKMVTRSSFKAQGKVEIKEKIVEVEPIKSVTQKAPVESRLNAPPERKLPEGVEWDFDGENWLDPFQVSHYAMDIFNYLKEREKIFPIGDYMEKQICLSRWMRSLLVDWMVEVQESFELNHETLYLAVKLVDLYLTKVTVGKETLQLLGAASLFIASKFDERIPPMVEDFLYICDGAYTQKELLRMEMNILKIVDYDLGIPLSYRFLRRYARCAKVSMPTLTLARYILEYSLMDYATIMFSDSKMAAAALFLALQMKDLSGWTPTLEYYTGYALSELKEVVLALNEGLLRKHKEALATVRNKYSHKIFFEVAKVPLKEVLDI
ncbi:G2/mitotic-specific cyclin-B3 [Leptopilina boulardi]|uniref:G2/mitotic-specific cyclin-B3 n=1 Tax=Leptopilina boulardi TaxID=63433 RepID=UPI0021F62085|nr:G2/mitotic-specific cyclin-B3 [Leptopilina boulardi]